MKTVLRSLGIWTVALAMAPLAAQAELSEDTHITRDDHTRLDIDRVTRCQARGLPVDRLADNWAFGCVLYEMLTGRKPFAGSSVTDTLAAVLEREPDWSALPPSTPTAIRRLLRRHIKRCADHEARRRQRLVFRVGETNQSQIRNLGSAVRRLEHKRTAGDHQSSHRIADR